MWSMGIANSYTLEVSTLFFKSEKRIRYEIFQATFCGSTQQDRAGQQFNTRDLESIGYHFLDSLLDYCDPDYTKVCFVFFH